MERRGTLGTRPRWLLLLAGGAAIALVSGVLGGLIGAAIHPGAANPSSGESSTNTCDVPAVTAQVLPSLVTIKVQTASGGGNGSGSVIDSKGDILTNDHVLPPLGTPGAVTVDFSRGETGVQARLVGRDPLTDLAVIRVQSDSASLKPISLGDSANLVVGQPVIAAGSPLGLESTVTSGIVSALSRYVNVGQGDQPALLVNAVQTDASINPGNSGGPLVDCSGHQIGVNSAGAQVPSSAPAAGGSIGLNFAIPIDFAQSVAKELIETGRATHQQIGVLGVTVTAEMSKSTGVPRGALVQQVIPGQGAAQAGLQEGDVITAVGDHSVNSVDQMLVQVREHPVGSSVDVTYVRDGARNSAQVSVSGVSGS